MSPHQNECFISEERNKYYISPKMDPKTEHPENFSSAPTRLVFTKRTELVRFGNPFARSRSVFSHYFEVWTNLRLFMSAFPNSGSRFSVSTGPQQGQIRQPAKLMDDVENRVPHDIYLNITN